MNKNKLLVAAMVVATIGTAQAEMTALQKQVIADHKAMQTMTASEKREFRNVIWKNDDKVAQRAYNRAYKEMAEAGFIVFEKNTNKAAANTRVQEPGKFIKMNKANNRRATGTISYHSGALSPATINSFAVGNVFNTGGTNPVESSGSITMFTADMAAVGGGAAFVSIFDQRTGTAANPVSSFSTALVTGVNTVTLATAINYVGPEFLAGVWNFTGGGDTINVATGTVGGQGFHGMQINDVAGTGFSAYTTLNAAFGVSGNISTPVELMNFSVE